MESFWITGNLLKLGLDFSLPCDRPKFTNHFLAFENIINGLSKKFKPNRQNHWDEFLSVHKQLSKASYPVACTNL